MTVPALRSLTAMLCFVTIGASSMMLSNAAYAAQASQLTHRASSKPLPPFASIRGGGVQALQRAGTLDTRGDARRERRETTSALVERRHGIDANHARNLEGLAGSSRSGNRSLRPPRQHPGWYGLHPRAPRPLRHAGLPRCLQCGPGRYERHLATGRPLPDETQAYVAALAPLISGAPTKVRPAAVGRSFAWANYFIVRNAYAGISTRWQIAGRHAPRAVLRAVTPLSVYPRSCRSRATCSYVLPERSRSP